MNENNIKKITRRNHYVPQGYLRFFENKRGHLFFYDKINKKIDETNTNKLAVQNDLYNGEDKEKFVSWEDFYTNEMDNIFPGIIKELIDYTKNPVIKKVLLMNEVKERLANLIVIQMLRVPERIFSQKENYDNILKEVEEEIQKGECFQKEEKIKLLKKYQQKKYYKGMVLKELNRKSQINKYTKILLSKAWLIYYNNTNTEFITSDNPVILYNHINNSVGMCNGIGRNDTLIGIPLTPKYFLIIFPNIFLFGKLKELFDNECITVNEIELIENLNRKQFESSIRQVYGNKKELIKKYTF